MMPHWLSIPLIVMILGGLVYFIFHHLAMDEKKQIPPGGEWHVGEFKASNSTAIVVYPMKGDNDYPFQLEAGPIYVYMPNWFEKNILRRTLGDKVMRAKRKAQRVCDRLNRKAAKLVSDEAEAERVVDSVATRKEGAK
jgi:hypothetical protein